MENGTAGSAADEAPRAKLIRALRRSWWLVAGTTLLLALGTVAVLFYMTPLYESEGALRIDREGPGFRGLEALEGLELLAGAGSPGVYTEMAVLRSRSLAMSLDAELSVRPEITRPRGVPRSRLFQVLELEPGVPEAEYRFTRAGEGYRVEARHREPPEVWRPFRRARWVEAGSAEVRPGEPFQVGGLAGVLTSDAPSRTGEILVEVPTREEFLERWSRRLVVDRPQREADVVEIRYRNPDPEVARDVVDLLQRRYIQDRREIQSREARATAGFLAEQLQGLRAELADAEEELRTFRETRQVILPSAEAEGEIRRLAEMQGRRDVTEADRRALQGLLDEIRAWAEASAGDGTISPWRRLVAFPTLLQNPATSELLQMLGELENERSALLETRTPEDLRVQLLTERIDQVEDQLRGIAETYLDGLRQQVGSLDLTLAGYRDELDRIPAVELEYVRRRRQVELLTEVLTVLETRQREAEIRASVEDMSVHIVDAGNLPREPVRPLPWVSLGLSLLVGLSLGTVGALVREGI